MLDFNHILLFVAFVSPLVLLARTARQGARSRGWQLASAAVLIISAISFFLIPEYAGFVGGSAWFVLLFVPAVGSRRSVELAAQERYGSARRLLGFLRLLHPSAAMHAEHSLLSGCESAQAGYTGKALEILQLTARSETPAGGRARAEIFRLRGDWNGLLEWCRENIPRFGLGDDPRLLPYLFRALGELGLGEELIFQFSRRASLLVASPINEPIFSSSLLTVLAFCGRTNAVRGLLAKRFPRMRPDAAASWIKTSERAVAAASLSRAGETALHRFEQDRTGLLISSARVTSAVLIIIALNVAMFALEILSGGATNSVVLYRLGALEPAAALAGQYWRLGSALFLHYGALHLLVNLYALYVLGPALEAIIGSWRFGFCYLLSGLGSSAGVIALWRFGWTQADLLVGASGAVMGIVGTWAGLLIRRRHLPMARRRLLNIAIIVAIQTAFDFSTPQVSMGAHLSGFASGVLLGFIIAPRERASRKGGHGTLAA